MQGLAVVWCVHSLMLASVDSQEACTQTLVAGLPATIGGAADQLQNNVTFQALSIVLHERLAQSLKMRQRQASSCRNGVQAA